jgi:DNA-binding PadR family transcriptional regulator
MMKVLTNAELMILQIIRILGQVSGYNINLFVDKMGYRKWADIGKTSIYSALKKLEKKELVLLFIDTEKTGKGPTPKKYSITDVGCKALKREMISTIKTSKNRCIRLDLVISCIEIFTNTEILQSFEDRKAYLNTELERVSAEYDEQYNCITPGGKLLFQHIIINVENEIKFADMMIKSHLNMGKVK